MFVITNQKGIDMNDVFNSKLQIRLGDTGLKASKCDVVANCVKTIINTESQRAGASAKTLNKIDEIVKNNKETAAIAIEQGKITEKDIPYIFSQVAQKIAAETSDKLTAKKAEVNTAKTDIAQKFQQVMKNHLGFTNCTIGANGVTTR